MISELILTYSWWWIVAVILAGLLYASLLYLKNPLSRLSKRVSVFLFILRFVAVSLLAFLLLSPFIKKRTKTLEKPEVVIGIDNSASMVLTPDSSFVRKEFAKKLQNLISEISRDYKTDVYFFGEEVQPADGNPSYLMNYSDYSSFISYVKNNYKGLNLGSVVLVGDGIYNKGVDPSYLASSLPWPVYTVALGDTTTHRDLKINDVRYNNIVYLDDNFPLEIYVSAKKLKGKKATVRVQAFGDKVFEQQFVIGQDDFDKKFRLNISAGEKGKHRITISLTVFQGELNKQNNRRSIFVNVLNTRKKVLIVAEAPHPDISAIRQSLEHYRNYEVKVVYAGNLKESVKDYNLVILHQLPSKKHDVQELLNQVKKNEIPVMFVLGRKSSVLRFNEVSEGFQIKSAHGFEVAQPVVNNLFSLFAYDKEFTLIMDQLPPLTVPFGNYIIPSFSQVFAYQRINNIETEIPLVLFYPSGSSKYGVITGEGMWLWRMHNYLLSGNFNAFETFLGKTVQYLLARDDKQHFRIIAKDSYDPGDHILIRSRLYNSSWEIVNRPDVELILTNEAGEKFKYSFNKYEDYYLLNIDRLPAGVYKYQASVKLGENTYADKGEFVVRSVTVERLNLKANHQMFFNLSDETGGVMLFPEQMKELPGLLKNNINLKTKIIYSYRTEGLNNLPILLFLILLLLMLEWFLRKYFGSY